MGKQNYEHLPKTVPEAVNWILVRLSEDVRQQMLDISDEEELIGKAHLGLGMWIRNELLKNNAPLERAVGGHWNEGRSVVLIQHVYARLKRGNDLPRPIDSLIRGRKAKKHASS
jgi:hypothetical protein